MAQMGRCGVCQHGKIEEIEKHLIAEDRSYRELSKEYGMSHMLYKRHKDNCMGYSELQKNVKEALLDSTGKATIPSVRNLMQTKGRGIHRLTPTLLDELMDIRDICMGIEQGALNPEKSDYYLALAALKERRAVVETLAKLALISHRDDSLIRVSEPKAPEELKDMIEAIINGRSFEAPKAGQVIETISSTR